MADVANTQQDHSFPRNGADEAAAMLKVIGNEHRLTVLCMLTRAGEMSVGAIHENVSLSQAALSQHLGRMREHGLITYRRESQTLYYRIARPEVETILATLKSIYGP